MEITIDIDRLRRDLKDYYGTGAFGGFPAMMAQVWEIDRMSPQELVQEAIRAGFDIFRYHTNL